MAWMKTIDFTVSEHNSVFIVFLILLENYKYKNCRDKSRKGLWKIIMMVVIRVILGGKFMSEWNAALYDNKHDFVAEYGKGLLEFVPENNNQSILDFGCGTGILTVQLKKLAEVVIGVDSSESMIKWAQQQYPDIKFIVSDALALPFVEQFDVVFLNAVFHWITDHNALLIYIKY